MATTRSREFWTKLIDEFERSGRSQGEFAATHEVTKASLQFWLYRLRRERRGKAATPRLLPVTVAPTRPGTPLACGMEMVVAGCVVRFVAGADCDYIARLAMALQGAAVC